MSTYPSELPNPTKASHTPKARNFATDLEGPASYANRERDFTRTIAVEFFFTAEQAAIFYAWWRDDLIYGGMSFNCTWPSLVTGPMVAQFLTEPSFDHVYNGAHRIAASVVVRGRSLPVYSCLVDPYYNRPAGDPYWANVVLLLHGDGSFADSSSFNRTPTVSGATISTATKKYGAGAMSMDGASDYVQFADSVDFDFGSGNFTIEFWLNPTSNSAPTIIRKGVSFFPFAFFLGGGTNSFFRFYNTANAIIGDLTVGAAFSTGVWTHVAAVRNGSVFSLYYNGISVATFSSAVALKVNTDPLVIGGESGAWFNGYIDDLRITKGIARYTGNFVAPARAFPDTQATFPQTGDSLYADTVFWFQAEDPAGGNALLDNSKYFNPLTLTPGGGAALTRIDYTTKIQGYSSWYNGSDGYFDTPTAAHLRMDTADFFATVRVYRISETPTNAVVALVGQQNATGTAGRWFLGYHGAAVVGGVANRAVLYADGNQRIISTATVPLNAWCEISVSCASGTLRLFVNGNLEGSVARPFSFNAAIPMTVNRGGSGASSMIGYIDNVRIVKGQAVYTASYTPDTLPTGTFPGFTVLSLHGETLTDSSSEPKTLTAVNGGPIVGPSPRRFGRNALQFTGTRYLTSAQYAEFNFGADDFSIETWLYLTADSASGKNGGIVGHGQYPSNQCWVLYVQPNSHRLTFNCWTASTEVQLAETADSLTLNQWAHIMICRKGANLYLFVDGVLVRSATFASPTTSLKTSTAPLDIGNIYSPDGYSNGYLQGYIDDLRITRGAARETATFTPPTLTFCDRS